MKLAHFLFTVIVMTLFVCVSAEAAMEQTTGKVNFLRIHDVGGKYGPPSDQIDVEVVIKLSSKPGQAFGFKLRNNANRPVNKGMLALLRDAYSHNWNVTINYNINPGKMNGVINRVWLSK